MDGISGTATLARITLETHTFYAVAICPTHYLHNYGQILQNEKVLSMDELSNISELYR